MRLVRMLALATLALITASSTAASTLTGDELLAAAADAPGLQSYTVPVRFDVHLHKPIGTHSRVDGTANFEKPGRGALAITKATGIIGGFFRGIYHLDLVPQTWPANYHVLSVATSSDDGIATTTLTAQPKTGDDIAEVQFRLAGHPLTPVAALWTYVNHATIALTFVNGRAGAYTLPTSATVSVDMPKYKLDATATYGTYALNAPIDPSVFATR